MDGNGSADFDAINKAAGNGIRLLRENLGMTVEQVAKLLNVTTTELRRYETGESPIPAATLFLCTKVFGTTHDFLFWPHSDSELSGALTDNVVRFPARPT